MMWVVGVESFGMPHVAAHTIPERHLRLSSGEAPSAGVTTRVPVGAVLGEITNQCHELLIRQPVDVAEALCGIRAGFLLGQDLDRTCRVPAHVA